MKFQLRHLFKPAAPSSPWNTDALIREELFSIERLEHHAATLAAAQDVTKVPLKRRSLNARLIDNEAVLLAAYRAIGTAVSDGQAITPAAEWLIDNYHLVEEQIRQIKDDLPPRFYKQLPKLASGPFAGYPRVFGLAWACVAHTDSRFDSETLRRFVHAYQQVQPLTIGELWAVAITLRVVLVENLRRAAARIVNSRLARQEADHVADGLLSNNGSEIDTHALVLHQQHNGDFSAVFVVQLVQRLRDQDPRVLPALMWLENKVNAQGMTIEQVVHDEHHRQSASNVTVRNIITSMRLISDVNWPDFFEAVSLVDTTLCAASDFASMDFATRNLYRSVIEQLARGSKHSELEVTHAVVAAIHGNDQPVDSDTFPTHNNPVDPEPIEGLLHKENGVLQSFDTLTIGTRHERKSEVIDSWVNSNTAYADSKRDPGYYLLTTGRRAFEQALGYRAPFRHWPIRFNAARGPSGYIGMVLLVAAIVLAAPLYALHSSLINVSVGLLMLCGVAPAFDLAMALVNRMVTREFGATMLPALALREGVPLHLRTLVVVPVLLTTAESIEVQLERLEVHYLASSPGEVYFALLSDWVDACAEHMSGDAALLEIAINGIARLNRIHEPAATSPRFYLFHRRRAWSIGQQQWMGWERKRGKLHELNRLLRGATDTTFINGNSLAPQVPAAVRYVITLDADTRLPRETVRRLVGKLAHPLNQPRFDSTRRRVIEGYAILQPRVTPSLPIGREGSLFQRVFSSMTGIDAYDAAVSDVYQDLFGEGSYAGKGIYDIDAFEAALNERVADDSLLSHDLFEGTFARAGLVSDIEVVEEFPSSYGVAAARTHRWARGDWQLLPWIVGRRDLARKLASSKDSLPLIARWKMLDNLRRTLSAPSCVIALIVGWSLPLHAALIWTVFILATIVVPVLLPLLSAIMPRHRGISMFSHLYALRNDSWLAILQILFTITLLADQAWLMTDAICRTLFRLVISKRNLLEWITAAQAQLSSRLKLLAIYRRMAISVFMAIAVIAVVYLYQSSTWWLALPFAMLWLLAPAIARLISISPLVAGRVSVSFDDARALRLIARRTWRYFETFVTHGDHMLPPDNFQEDPQHVIAHRTSPTNIGLYLLSTVSAHDFGWIGINETVERIEATMATLQRLPRHRGHFYNWYDTRDLRALDPRYVSTVDSGNLAAHLIAVANACKQWSDHLIINRVFIAGIEEALQLTRWALHHIPDTQRTSTITRQQLEHALNVLSIALGQFAINDFDSDGHPAKHIISEFDNLTALAATVVDTARALANEHDDEAHDDLLFWTNAVNNTLESWHRDITQSTHARRVLQQRLRAVESTTRAMALAMEFDFLLDPERKLLSIGYLVNESTLDPSCYDLLASEARLASFFAIAKNDVATRHWFRLGRAVTAVGHGAALISWSGSMFEYLMPSLVVRAPVGSLLEQTSRLIVQRQIQYGAVLNVPWGVSESAYSARDLEFTYQYSNFGVPGLGLKRGLSENLVIAPYATGLAAMVDPQAAARNFEQLTEAGAQGRYGFYEALDYTRTRLPEDADVVIVRNFMAHHQGMTIVSIANVLFDGRMRARFHAEASVQATELLLQERTPRDVSIAHPRAEEVNTAARISGTQLPEVRRLHTPHDATPQTHLLSNGRYAVMLTSAGSGYSQWRELAITRWREDATRDDGGSYIFLRDVKSGKVWSAGYQPAAIEPDNYQVTFTEDRAEFIRSDDAIITTLHVVVSPEDDAEVRRVSITNTSDEVREIDVTSYCELVLTTPAADLAHQVFSKLFVQTEYVAKFEVLLATRRRRSQNEPEVWAAHHVVVEGDTLGSLQYETDRAQFIGRGFENHSPIAVMDGRPLSNTVGTVLDPVFVLRCRVRILPGATARVSFWTEVASSRTGVLDLFDKHHDANAFIRATTLAWTQAQVQLRHLGITQEEAILFQRLAGHLLYANAALRPSSDTIQRGGGTAAALWAQSISGDIPVVLLRIDDVDDISVVRQLLQAHEYWQLRQLAVDVVILNERGASYVQDLQIALETLVRMSQSRLHIAGIVGGTNKAKGSVFVLRTDLISAETRGVLSSVARMVLAAQRGSLAEQLDRRTQPPYIPVKPRPRSHHSMVHGRTSMSQELEFFNGLGGFTADGREYVTCLDAGQTTPAPWINVIANAQFGFQVAVEGSGYTWAVNSREHQLTQWSNDPVVDRPSEVLYVRDEETGELWGPTSAPIRDTAAPYYARHGQGYSCFEHHAHGIALELLMYVPLHDSIKICRLKIKNTSTRRRHLSVTAYIEWVLGTTRGASAPFIVTEIDTVTGAMFARNPWNAVYGSRVAFADLAGQQTQQRRKQLQWTADRCEFLGRHGRLEQPAALTNWKPLSKRTGAGLDPCCALQTSIELEREQTTEIVFLLGEAASAKEAQALLTYYHLADLDTVLQQVKDYWDEVLGKIQVKTPDRSMDIMLNRWLLYQTLACRTWARSAFYQASGAYGFRDQLQDGMALVIAQPALTREHLLRAAGRQFPQGDVQHWWLPPTGQGVRTHISDDRIWLAYAAARYLDVTDDTAVLDEQINFIEGAKLPLDQHDAYFLPAVSEDSATFFEHCARGLDASLAVGIHGLPLIGTGDWNDGMNRVGEQGRGESVWLGWFLHTTLSSFAAVAMARGETERANSWLDHASTLRHSLEREAWDGEWYRRGYFDDGTAFGSAQNDECRIDSIAQSWSVISQAGDPVRAMQAMTAVDEQLIRRKDSLALLFTPPFNRTLLEPGYIKGYPPGLRENGGQYTHAATWSVIAFAMLGAGDKAAELFALLNPINHSSTRTGLRKYKVEPYVVAADVYSVAPHVGRGGWTWYTGAAGWLYRAGVESILGLHLQGNHLLLKPCIPKQWPRFEMVFKHGTACYEIIVDNSNAVSHGVLGITLDGTLLPNNDARILLQDDGATHYIQVTLG